MSHFWHDPVLANKFILEQNSFAFASSPANHPPMISIFLGLTAATVWAFHDLLARVFTPRFGAFRMAMLVLLLGAAILLPVVLWRGQLSLLTGALAVQIVLMGLVYFVALAGLLKAFSLAPVSVVGPLTAGYPALVVVWGLFNGLTPTAFEWLAIAIILAGAIMVGKLGPPDGGMASVPKGQATTVILACVAACLGFAAAIVLGQSVSAVIGPYETTFLSRFPAALAMLPLMLRERPDETRLSGNAVLAASGMALCDVIAVTTINVMGQFPNKEFGTMAVSAYGAIAALLALWLLKEKAATGQWLGIGLIVIGIALLGTPK
jgi:drug/metabolite transporter (DMT)-like permease